ncbi:glutamate-cysteine ligase family protein [Polyangium spumosum]|uniref:Glutamate--cysteine ligase n=1 Tax=Polyangium spumosum TaxID=889282 RepID=A0A6N7PPM0_9BACT|nr:glutamate-cysteine ligase family protein [Polyangium spumosum]MRG94142.1 glutamate--cysteine ligase [Polyangium spumosum]
MGLLITRDDFSEDEFVRFSERLRDELDVLDALVSRPGFGEGPATVGAELELFLVDPAGLPLPANREVLARTVDPRFTVELDRFNLEFNARPCPLAGRPFSALVAEFEGALAEINRAARDQGGRIVPIGILPTLRREDLTAAEMTDVPRYRALGKRIRRLRGGPFHVRIHGDDPLALDTDDVAMEGAGTSFQVHLRVPPGSFSRYYNAAQIATIPALAASGNSPILIGHRLWDETRIALFRQAVDDRLDAPAAFHPPSRVSFGYGWVREGAAELFAESVRLYAPLLPVLGGEDARKTLQSGGVPELAELRLHHGTVWRWNRAVYDPAGGGHFRIEFRALPAGPTVIDMLASAAFLLGVTIGLAPEVDHLLPAYPFELARHAFYRAAQHGLDAIVPYPSDEPPSPRATPIAALCERLVPLARSGLLGAGVVEDEADRFLGVFLERVRSRQTGARWQRAALEALGARFSKEEALRRMLAHYEERAASGEPVHAWAKVLG